jgi:membrane-associated protease RseP (regulator of RpoE activity)
MLHFRLFGIPVGVHATFLLIVLFGRPRTVLEGVLWFFAAFVAILMHELGHALVARRLGGEGISVMLFGFGGLTSFSHGPNVTHGRSFLISAAGSAVGIVAGLAVVASGRAGLLDSFPDNAITFLEFFVFAALVWGVLNWIPIVPLDGGHMVQHAFGLGIWFPVRGHHRDPLRGNGISELPSPRSFQEVCGPPRDHRSCPTSGSDATRAAARIPDLEAFSAEARQHEIAT